MNPAVPHVTCVVINTAKAIIGIAGIFYYVREVFPFEIPM
jgi:predicted secreted protein